MDDLFKIRVLTAALNSMKPQSMKVYNRIFRGKEHMEPTDRLAFDVISGSEGVLKNLSIYAPAQVTDKTQRKTITLTAPRLAQKRFLATADLNAARAFGAQIGTEMMKRRIGVEQKDMRGTMDRTLEYWAVNALKGQILDADLSTVLVDYNMKTAHRPTLTGDALWTDADSDPIQAIRSFKQLIEDDCAVGIDSWVAFLGSGVMDALIAHAKVKDFLKYDLGSQIAEGGKIKRLAEVDLEEYNGSFVDSGGTRRRFVGTDEFLLLGICDEMVDVPYAPIVDDDAPGGVGNVDAKGKGVLYFSKSWKKQDPSGRWIKAETRPLPVLQRPDAVIDATVI